MIDVDRIEIEGSSVWIIEVVTDLDLDALQAAADSCVPAWVVALVIVALAGREAHRWLDGQHRP